LDGFGELVDAYVNVIDGGDASVLYLGGKFDFELSPVNAFPC